MVTRAFLATVQLPHSDDTCGGVMRISEAVDWLGPIIGQQKGLRERVDATEMQLVRVLLRLGEMRWFLDWAGCVLGM